MVTLILALFQRKIDTNFSCLLIGGWLIPYRWFYLAATHKKLDKEVEQTDQANTKAGEIDCQGEFIGLELGTFEITLFILLLDFHLLVSLHDSSRDQNNVLLLRIRTSTTVGV